MTVRKPFSNADRAELAGRFESAWFRNYAKSKLRIDPLYNAVFEELKTSELPILDIGCGLGLLGFYLRYRGIEVAIKGIDYDARKIATAQKVSSEHYEGIEFSQGDARLGVPDFLGNVTILDILQFFTPDEQQRLLKFAAQRVAVGGKLVIRSGLRDSSWRYRITQAGDILAKATLWMKAAPTCYPTRDAIQGALEAEGFQGVVRPLWGKTPFNNYLAAFERRA